MTPEDMQLLQDGDLVSVINAFDRIISQEAHVDMQKVAGRLAMKILVLRSLQERNVEALRLLFKLNQVDFSDQFLHDLKVKYDYFAALSIILADSNQSKNTNSTDLEMMAMVSTYCLMMIDTVNQVDYEYKDSKISYIAELYQGNKKPQSLRDLPV